MPKKIKAIEFAKSRGCGRVRALRAAFSYAKRPFRVLKGHISFNPGLRRRSYPGYKCIKDTNPERVAANSSDTHEVKIVRIDRAHFTNLRCFFLLTLFTLLTAPASAFFSRNGEYFVVLNPAHQLSKDREQILLSAVHKFSTNGTGAALWTNYVSGIEFPTERWYSISVSDDASCFVAQSNLDTWKIVAKDQPSRTITLTRPPAKIRWGRSSYSDDTLVYFDQFDGQPIVRFWRRDPDHWQAFFTHLDKELPATADLIAKWNRDTRESIINEMARVEADVLKRKLNQLSPTLGAIAKPNSLWRPRPRAIHYEFLASRHVPADRQIFEELIQHKARGAPGAPNFTPVRRRWGGFSVLLGAEVLMRQPSEPYTYESEIHDRSHGDWLLAVFDQHPQINSSNRRGGETGHFYLGRLKGSIQLPLPIVDKAGIIRIYLAPADRAGKNWADNSIDFIEEHLLQESRYWGEKTFTNQINFVFNTVTPGPVRLKAIWDKRPRFDDQFKAGPGDYESDWSPPINITAGSSVSNVVLICNKRAESGGETYYTVDDIRARNWRKQGEAAFLPTPPIPNDMTEIYSAPASQWITHRLSNVPGRGHGLVQISIVRERVATSTYPQLLAIFANAKKSNDIIDPYTLRLYDETDGAKYIPTHTHTTAQFTYATFPYFPRTAETFRLIAYGKPNTPSHDHSTNSLFDLTLTNLWRSITIENKSAPDKKE